MKTLEEHFIDLTSNFPDDYVESYNKVLNAVKALDIIKNKKVDTIRLSNKEDLEEYNNNLQLSSERKTLTQEEYNLLKEVFTDD